MQNSRARSQTIGGACRPGGDCGAFATAPQSRLGGIVSLHSLGLQEIKCTPPCIGTDANCQLIQQWEPPTLKLVPSGISRSANSGQGWARGLLQPRHVAHSLSILHPAKGYVAKHAHCVRTCSFQHQSRETSLCKTREPDRRPLAAHVGQVETAELLLQLRSRDLVESFRCTLWVFRKSSALLHVLGQMLTAN